MILIGGALQVESAVIVVDDLKHGHVFGRPLCCIELLLEAALAVVLRQHQVIARAHDHRLKARFQRLFRQMTTLVVEEAVAVTAPGDALHEDAKIELTRGEHE